LPKSSKVKGKSSESKAKGTLSKLGVTEVNAHVDLCSLFGSMNGSNKKTKSGYANRTFCSGWILGAQIQLQ